MPVSQDALEEWLAGHCQRVEAKGDDVVLHPAVADFQRLIASDPVIGMYVTRMIEQVPETRSCSKRHLKDPAQLLSLINEVLTMAPEFGDQSVTLPLGAILDWSMGTPAGFAAFRDPKVNDVLKKILSAWCDYLDSPESLYVLNDSPTGWTSEAARQAIGIEQFEHDPTELGHFQFGGSTHCLVFGPGVIGDFALDAIPQPNDPDAPLVCVRSRLATAARETLAVR